MYVKSILLLLVVVAPAFAGPEIQHWQTSGGAKVYFIETHELPMVDIQVNFDAGSARDPQSRLGLAALTNSLLAEAAGQLNADQISYEFERLGAIYGANAGYDSASVSLRSLVARDKLDKALAMLRKVMSQPEFPSRAIERQRKRFLTGLQHKQQSPGALAKDAFYAAVYGKHPYAYPQEGTEETLKSISRDDLLTFHRQYYVSANAVIAIVGDLDRAAAQALAEELSQSLSEGRRAAALPQVSALPEARDIREDHPSTQTHILLGQPGVKRGDADYFPLYVANHILGGSGLVSLLFKEIREKRALSYSAYSYFSPMREVGPFVAGLSTRADQADKALQVLREEIARFVNEGPSKAMLEAAKKNITGGFPLRIDSNSNLLGYATVIGFYELPLDYLETFNENIEAVTVADIKDALSRRLHPQKMVSVMVGPLTQTGGQTH